jgi:acyl-CoA synthetase (NDP forming)
MPVLSALLAPRSIALIGASPDAGKLPGRPLAYLKRYGFTGEVYAVNPKYTDIDGTPCVARIADLPRDIDLAMILLPAAGVADALHQCALQGVRTAISIAGGFAEAGDAAAQEVLSALCQQYGIRLIGPNCVGVLNPALGMTATFSSELRRRMPRPGRLALFTQSGALGNALLQSFNDLDIGLAYWVSTGNEADLGVLELVEHAIEDEGVDLIGLYVEGLKGGSELMALARRARAKNKAIMVLRAGQSQLGRAAAVSHTGKLAGAWKVWCDVARQAGLITVDSLDDMIDLAVAFQALGYPQSTASPSLGVLTISGGMGVLISDEAARFGVPLPPFAAGTQAALRELLPPQMSVANPVDTALFANEGGFGACAEAVIRDPGIGVLLVVLTRLAHDYKALLPWLERLALQGRSQGKALAVSYLSSSDPFEREDRLRLLQAGVLMLPTPERLVAALGRRAQVLVPLGAGDVPQAARAGSDSVAQFLKAAAVPQVPEQVFMQLDDAAAFARQQGFPVVLKVVSPDIAHKSEAGGVALNLGDEDALRQAWQAMVRSVAAHAPTARIEGYSVQPMVLDGFELIVGCSIDPELGRVLMVGAGGIWAEVLDDVGFLALPASRQEIADLIGRLKIAPILTGARGQDPLDVVAAVEVIWQIGQQFLVDDWVAEVDINPLRLRALGRGAVALDTLVLARHQEAV